MNSKAVGEVSQGQILAALLKQGDVVLIPFGDNQRYDLVIDREGEFLRVQCKTARITNKGQLTFDVCSSYKHRGKGTKDYKGDADFFAVYSPDLNKCYWIPVQECGTSQVFLRLTEAKNKQSKRVRWAKDFEL